ncbi:MAG: FecR domain-containing protein [Fidelibacterota bacterium]
MKNFKSLLLFFFIVPFLLAFNSNNIGILSLILGRVEINKNETGSWKKAELKSTVNVGDQLKTAEKSRCEIKTETEMVIRIGEKSILVVNEDLKKNSKIQISQGSLWINLFINGGKKVNVRTPTAVASIRGTVYRISCNPNYSNFRVYDGSVSIAPLDELGKEIPDTTFLINQGDELTIVKDFNEYKRQQREAFERYLNEKRLGFEEYKQQQNAFFQAFKRKEEEAFKKYKSLNIAIEKFDQYKDSEFDWVKWNKERDNVLNKQSDSDKKN